MDWLEEELGGFQDDYLIFDCPGMAAVFLEVRISQLSGKGQIELYTHHPFLPTLVQNLSRLGIRTCAVYLIESQFMEDRYKFFRYV
jgi:GPN-loop GTPase